MGIRERASKVHSCPDYVRASTDSRRCKRYRDRLCELDTHPLCEEWLRSNPKAELPHEERFADAGYLLQRRSDYRMAVIDGSYFGPGWERKLGPGPGPDSDELTSGQTRTLDRLPSDVELASWKRLDVEVCIESPAIARVWLVPGYTKTDRDEISIDDAMTMLRVLTAFPGSRVEQFIRRRQNA